MLIDSISLVNYRTYPKNSFDFKPITAILGSNGVGKTNLLEAIRYISIMKSFRAKREREVVTFGQTVTRIVGKGEVNNQKTEISIGLSFDASLNNNQINQKVVRVNRSKKRISQAVGIFKTVLFAPDDLDFVTGSPSLRRRFLDLILSQEKPAYLTALLELYRVVRHRNIVLNRIAQNSARRSELEIWDQELIRLGQIIQPIRQELIEMLNTNLSKRYQAISGQDKSTLTISYQPSILSPDLLKSVYDKDVRFNQTTLGPNHDDIKLILNKKSLATYGSRGERRSAVLSLKQAEVAHLTVTEPPILLLDDILSELDSDRQHRLVNLFDTQQTIITATHLSKELEKVCQKVIKL